MEIKIQVKGEATITICQEQIVNVTPEIKVTGQSLTKEKLAALLAMNELKFRS